MIPDELHTFTARVITTNGYEQSSGTAFFVARGLLLTCAHVLLKSDGTIMNWRVNLEWNGLKALAEVQSPLNSANFPDLALLRVDLAAFPEWAYHPIAQLSEDARQGDTATAYGYSALGPLGDPVKIEIEGWKPFQSAEATYETLKLKEGQVVPGLSGSPLLNWRTERICGIVKMTRNELTDLGGMAVSAGVILQTFPELESAFETGISPDAPNFGERRELAAIVGAGVSPKAAREIYVESLPMGAQARASEATMTLSAILRDLAAYPTDPRTGLPPALRFARALQRALQPAVASSVRGWLIQALRNRHLPDALADTDKPASSGTLSLFIITKKESYNGNAALTLPDNTQALPTFRHIKELDRAGLEEWIAECIRAASPYAPGGMVIEFFLPTSLLFVAWEKMTLGKSRFLSALGEKYIVVFRSMDRIQLDSVQEWNRRWTAVTSGPAQSQWRAAAARASWQETVPSAAFPEPEIYYLHLRDDETIAIVGFDALVHGTEEHEAFMEATIAAGIPIVIWRRKALANSPKKTALALFDKNADVARYLWERKRAKCGDCSDIVLLWDDPTNVPAQFPVLT